MIPFTIIGEIEPIFGFGADIVVPPDPSMLPTIPGGMRPFSRFMYRDRIGIRRVAYDDVEGAKVASYPIPPEALELANVQSERVERIEPGSDRITVVYLHTVYTPTNRSLRRDDQIEYRDRSGANHVLTVVAESSPRGIGDVSFVTQCIEVS